MTNPSKSPAGDGSRQRPIRRHRHWRRLWAAALLLLLVMVMGLRFVGQTAFGQAFLMATLDGFSLGGVGVLHVEDVQGDIWRDFTVKRLEIDDAQGPWLKADGLRIKWRWFALIGRRIHILAAAADQVQILRRPAIQASETPPASRPLSLTIDRFAARVETQPAFSAVRGLFQLDAQLDAERGGGVGGDVTLASLLHAGDGLTTRFRIGLNKRLQIDAQVQEGRGGALAGALGLPAAQRFQLDAHATGEPVAGILHLRASTGERSIAEADAAWNKGGGSGSGRLSLSASSFSARYLHELGPEIRLSGWGRSAGHGLYALDLQAAADNATLSATGVIAPAKTATHGDIGLRITIKDPTRIVASPTFGSSTLDGRLSGSPWDWRWTGRATLGHPSFGAYSLGQMSGPVRLRLAKREWRMQADLDGVGGEGAGFLAAAGGSRPHIDLDASRLPDGRLLLRTLKVQGDGVKLDATGERGLLGGLNFKGGLQLTNLERAKNGARGGVAAQWSAMQRKANEPWNFTLDGHGDKFATGRSEIDRLLGRAPRLRMEASWEKGAVVIAKSDLRGEAANAQVDGRIAPDGDLGLTLKWAARGPFELGPLEMAGDAAGAGTVKGPWRAPRADLSADFQRIDLPGLTLKPAHVLLSFTRGADAMDGQIAVTASGDYGLAHLRSNFRFVSDGLEFSGVDAAAGGATAVGSLALRSLRPSSGDLTIALGPGAFIVQGRADARLKIVDTEGGPTADLKLTAANLALPNAAVVVSGADISAHGRLDHLPYTVTADAATTGAPLHLKGGGILSPAGRGYSVSFEGAGRIRRADFRTQSPAQFKFDGPDHAASLILALGGGRFSLAVKSSGDALNAKASLAGVDLNALGEDLAGKVNADLTLNGAGGHLDGDLQAHLEGARSREAAADKALAGDIRAILSGDHLTFTATANGAKSEDKANLNLVLPVEAQAAPFRIDLNRVKPIQGRFDVNGELQPIWDLFVGGDRTLGGRLAARATIAGTLAEPRIEGHAALSQGRFEDAASGLKLRGLTTEVDLRDNVVDVQRFSAEDAGAGVLTGEGRVSLIKDGVSTLKLQARAFRLLDTDAAKVAASGDVVVTRSADGQAKLGGALTVDRADISPTSSRRPAGVVTLDVVEKNKPINVDAFYTTSQPSRLPSVALDVKISAPRHIFVHGLGLDAEMSLDATVVGTTAAPVLQGVAHVVRGAYDLAGKRFDIDSSGVVYLATSMDKVRLDLKATLDDPANTSLSAAIIIKGTAAKPEISLTSTPTLPSDEILSQVLFGSSAAQLSAFQAAELASAVTSLATGGGFDVMGGLRSFARLDRLAVGGTDLTGFTVSGGKYIGNNVYLQLTGGGRQGASAQVEVRANRALSIISQVGGDGGAKLSVRWRVDYGKVKKKPNP